VNLRSRGRYFLNMSAKLILPKASFMTRRFY